MPSTNDVENTIQQFADRRNIRSKIIPLVNTKKFKIFLSFIDNNPEVVLDLGCDCGWLSTKIKEKFNSEIYGVDINQESLIEAEKKGINVLHYNLGQKDWPFEDESFDLLIAGDVIEHVIDTETFVQECYRILKKDGLLIVSVPNINAYYNRLLISLGQYPLWIEAAPNISFAPFNVGWSTGHVRAFNRKAICKLLKYFNFEILKVKGVSGKIPTEMIPRKYKIFSWLLILFENFFGFFPGTASGIAVKAKK